MRFIKKEANDIVKYSNSLNPLKIIGLIKNEIEIDKSTNEIEFDFQHDQNFFGIDIINQKNNTIVKASIYTDDCHEAIKELIKVVI